MKRLNNSGDTIVEVLLAVIVVGGVLAAAYVSASHSLNANRASQERSEALKYVEGQVEQIKENVITLSASPPVGPGAGPYCLDKTTGAPDNITPPAGDPDINKDNFSYPGGCNQGLIAGGYHLSITQTSGTYTVRARWARVGGGGKEQMSIVYKVAP